MEAMLASLESWKAVVDLLTAVAALLGGGLAAIWAYSKWIVERGLLPPTELDVGCRVLGTLEERRLIEIEVRIENKGSSTLVVSNLRADVRYARNEEPALCAEPESKRFGSVEFRSSLLRSDLGFDGEILVAKENDVVDAGRRSIRVGKEGVVVLGREERILRESELPASRGEPSSRQGGRGLPLLRHDTFVQPGVKQIYTLVTALPRSALHALVFASFRYGARPSELQRAVLALARKLGLVQFSLDHVTMPHTAQRAFALRETSEAAEAQQG